MEAVARGAGSAQFHLLAAPLATPPFHSGYSGCYLTDFEHAFAATPYLLTNLVTRSIVFVVEGLCQFAMLC